MSETTNPDGPAVTDPAQDPAEKPAEDTTAPETVAEAGDNATEPTGEAYQKGYLGTVPSRDGDNPEDLTLQGVLKNQGQK